MHKLFSNTVVCVPVLNEVDTIAEVLEELYKHGFSQVAIGLDCKTSDGTEELLNKLNAPHVISSRTGYDGALLASYKCALQQFPKAKLVLTCDSGGKYDIASFNGLFEAYESNADIVLGTRIDHQKSMLWHQKLGTTIVLLPSKLLFRTKIQDLSSVRLMNKEFLESLSLTGSKFSLPTETIIKSLALKAVIMQVPIKMKPRKGTSKVSGSAKNSLRAGVDLMKSYKYVKGSSWKKNVNN